MSLVNETAKLLHRTGMCRFLAIERLGIRVRFFPTRISRRLWVDSITGHSKYGEMEEFLLRFIRPGDTIVDVGANIGWYTLIASTRTGESGCVHAFEAHPVTFRYLAENLRLNDVTNVRLYQNALGNCTGPVLFSDEVRDDMNRVVDHGGIQVHMSPLDAFPIPEDRINLMKVDVEGFELFVLQGATATLRKTDVILFEAWDRHMSEQGYTFSDVYDLLNRSGFTLLKPSDNGYIEIDRRYEAIQLTDLVAAKDPAAFLSRMRE